MVFLFVEEFIDLATGMQHNCQMLQVHSMYSELLFGLQRRLKKRENWNMRMADMKRHIDCFKKLECELFEAQGDSGLYTLNINMLDNLLEDVNRFDTSQLLDSYASEGYNVRIQSSYRSASKHHLAGMEGTLREMERGSMPEKVLGRANVTDKSPP